MAEGASPRKGLDCVNAGVETWRGGDWDGDGEIDKIRDITKTKLSQENLKHTKHDLRVEIYQLGQQFIKYQESLQKNIDEGGVFDEYEYLQTIHHYEEVIDENKALLKMLEEQGVKAPVKVITSPDGITIGIEKIPEGPTGEKEIFSLRDGLKRQENLEISRVKG